MKITSALSLIAIVFLQLHGETQAATVNLTEGLVAQYLFNGNANDSSGNGKHGVLNNVTATTDRFGNTGAAYSFSGNYSFVTAPTLVPVIGADATMLAWFKADPTQLFGQENIISQPRGNLPFQNQLKGLRLQINTGDGSSNFRVNAGYNDSSQNIVAFGPDNSAVANGGWHYAAVTISTDSTSKTLSLYLDGVLAQTASLSPTNIASDLPFFIGTQFDPFTTNNESPFIGAIDDVSVYNRALSAEEIVALSSVPEPSAISLFFFGGMTLLAFRKTTKNKI